MSRRISIFGSSFASGPVWEPETIAYMTAVGIPADATVYYPSTVYERTGLQFWQYTDALVIALKAIGWSKFKAFWPRLGGTADRHKWNLINPVDSDAAHRNVFFGGWTHSATGCLPNGTNGYINAHISPTQWTYNNVSFGFYNRSSLGGIKIVMGFQSSATMYWYPRADPTTYVRYGGAEIAYAQASETRLITLTQNATRLKGYRDGVLVADSPNSPNIAMQSITIPMYIQARNNNGTASIFGNRSEAGAFVADELTAAEVASVSAAIQTFNTSLGRNV
jgi:hypothetical protein